MNKITSFTAHQTAEGMRLTYTHSTIDDDGNITKSNERASIVVMDDDILKKINEINEFLGSKLEN